jgi:chemotaxis protein methyltransferase CheR
MTRDRQRVCLPEPVQGADFEYVRSIVKEHTAVALDASKVYLINARLLPVARAEGLDSVRALIHQLRGGPFSDLHTRSIEAIVTTETSFFRDFHPFEALRNEIIPRIIQDRRNGLRNLTIWSAGCSSGQEPYSVAILLRESFPELAGWTVRILASDVSKGMIDRTKSGIYSQIEINRGLPASYLVKYFHQQEGSWYLDDGIRNMVTVFQHNLAHAYQALPPIDILMMRNVLIYFDVETKRTVLQRARRQLRPGGFLMLGTAETTLNLDESFDRLRVGRAVLYQTGRKDPR